MDGRQEYSDNLWPFDLLLRAISEVPRERVLLSERRRAKKEDGRHVHKTGGGVGGLDTSLALVDWLLEA
jgi:hypothetical protein